RPRPPSTLLPYTTLFRSRLLPTGIASSAAFGLIEDPSITTSSTGSSDSVSGAVSDSAGWSGVAVGDALAVGADVGADAVSSAGRSEEHTSELQSRENLVC